jgi:hypothetical protein
VYHARQSWEAIDPTFRHFWACHRHYIGRPTVARAADTKTTLSLNEYGSEYTTPDSRQRRQNTLALLHMLRNRNTLMDCFGFSRISFAIASSPGRNSRGFYARLSISATA